MAEDFFGDTLQQCQDPIRPNTQRENPRAAFTNGFIHVRDAATLTNILGLNKPNIHLYIYMMVAKNELLERHI